MWIVDLVKISQTLVPVLWFGLWLALHNSSESLDLLPWSQSPLYLAGIADVDRGLSEIPSGKR
jgi:hypothetical protein